MDLDEHTVFYTIYRKSKIGPLGITMSVKMDAANRGFYTACLIALKKWEHHPSRRNKILNIIRTLVTTSEENISGPRFKGWELLIKYVTNPARYDNWVDQEFYKCKNFSGVEPVVSFYLFCLLASVENRVYKKSGSRRSSYYDADNASDCMYNEIKRSLPDPVDI